MSGEKPFNPADFGFDSSKSESETDKVRIAWKDKEAGTEGHGKYLNRKDAESYLEELKKDCPDMEHWLESETDKEN